MVARIALAAVAIVIAAGFAVQLHAHRLLRNAVGELEREVNAVKDPAANRRAVHDAQRVADLRPGTTGLFTAIALDTRAKRLVAAERTALRATRREPENFASWLTLALVQQQRGEKAAAATALARVRRLNPLYPTPR